ncbi:hypothetical protein EDD15DRAFT_2467773 [Pisolithus albus]|nr:hypothetical protein EDD15DRAFT_2467773 [Pisolithus albus]
MPTQHASTIRLLAGRLNLLDSGFYLGDSRTFFCGDEDENGKFHVSSFEPAPLCAIATIDRDDFWLTPLAGYHKPSAIWHDLASVKLSCAVAQPPVEPVKQEFHTVMENLRQLQGAIATPAYQAGKGFILSGGQTGDRLKLRHLLFEMIGNDKVDHSFVETLTGDGNTVPSPPPYQDTTAFSIENWPVDDNETKTELENLKATHRLIPLPAYDVEGNLIEPHAYQRSLQGALVKLYFNMSHWAIAGKNGLHGSDVFTAEIQMIRVIDPPRPTITSNKRKVSLYIHPESNCNKKFRAA